jgi:SAM-dependent methyltransferase
VRGLAAIPFLPILNEIEAIKHVPVLQPVPPQNMTSHFVHVTEQQGQGVSEEKLERHVSRYVWALEFCRSKDVVEVACGGGQGLQLLKREARSLIASDVSDEVLVATRATNFNVDIRTLEAENIPCADASIDVVILFEALYYLPYPEKFFEEARRVLRSGGYLLIATANKDLFDFNPSPFSHRYLGVAELGSELGNCGFETSFFGGVRTDRVSLRQRILRPIKYGVVNLGLMPKTIGGKALLKRLVFGKMRPLPASVDEATAPYEAPEPISAGVADRVHKVVFCAAHKK